jgi:hypothetical protein
MKVESQPQSKNNNEVSAADKGGNKGKWGDDPPNSNESVVSHKSVLSQIHGNVL